MRTWIFLFFLIITLACGAREVYKSVSEDGVVSYSDTYKPGAESVSVSDKKGSINNKKNLEDNTSADTDKNNSYQSFSIDSPKNQETIRNSEGSVSVGLSLSPGLAPQHVIHVYLNGKQLKTELKTTQFTLKALNKGTHSLQAKIVDSEGVLQLATESINFHLRKDPIESR